VQGDQAIFFELGSTDQQSIGCQIVELQG
jgi:hypothetical protein